MHKYASYVRIVLTTGSIFLAILFVALASTTLRSFRPLPDDLSDVVGEIQRSRVLDRTGQSLTASYTNTWNVHDVIALHDVPEFLVQSFIRAEDKRFFQHKGQDWLARGSATIHNLVSWSAIRGASTISEQVVRMIHLRERTVWSRWIEGWEAVRLEMKVSKSEILEFFLNQVPYASNRRGVVQAANFYFDRDLSTLNQDEMMVLAVLVRSPSRLDPRHNSKDLLEAVDRLKLLVNASETSRDSDITDFEIDLRGATLDVHAPHFVRYVRSQVPARTNKVRTTLNPTIQRSLSEILASRLQELSKYTVTSGAVVVADFVKGEILAWVVGSADATQEGSYFDSVLVHRQPGSTLKPFLYAAALERGWTAAKLLDDSPLSERVLNGIHHYRNYSNHHYGPVTLRIALGNSLNIPAVRTLRFVGESSFLKTLQELGFHSLDQESTHYGGGLALGNGELSLLELVHAYGALANRGAYKRFSILSGVEQKPVENQVFSPEVASLISDILSDSSARSLEFGAGLLNFPYQTAVKTGTSTGFRDSWALGYDDRYVVGAWMGNLDQRPMVGITGSRGPAYVVRTAFDLLNQNRDPSPLWLSSHLVPRTICIETGLFATRTDQCPRRTEYFEKGPQPESQSNPSGQSKKLRVEIVQPTEDLVLAIDPREPIERQAFEFLVESSLPTDKIELWIDEQVIETTTGKYLWNLVRGRHSLQAFAYREGELLATADSVTFEVR